MVCFDRSRYHNTIGATAPSTESSEEIRILTLVGCDDFTRCEHNFVFENLVGCQPEGVACCAVTTTLQVASNRSDSL